MVTRARPGEWYYGPTCRRCGAFIPLLWDDEHGRGRPVQLQSGTSVRLTCPDCGHSDSHRPHEYGRQQVH